jgi:hypothetical protein
MMLDDRHMRESLIAFTAIVLIWSTVCALTFASTLFFGREANALDGPTAMIGDWLQHQGAGGGPAGSLFSESQIT